jgi:hypothetical protein
VLLWLLYVGLPLCKIVVGKDMCFKFAPGGFGLTKRAKRWSEFQQK